MAGALHTLSTEYAEGVEASCASTISPPGPHAAASTGLPVRPTLQAMPAGRKRGASPLSKPRLHAEVGALKSEVASLNGKLDTIIARLSR